MRPFRNLRGGTDGSPTFEQVRYAPADPVIEDVRFDPPSPQSGDTVQIEIDVLDTKTTATGESGEFNAFAVVVESPQLDQHILARCEIIRPGQTITVDDSTGDFPGFDGEFPATGEMDIAVVVTGWDPRQDCTPGNISDAQLDNPSVSQTYSLDASGEETEPPSVSATNVELPVGDTYQTGDSVVVDATFENTGGPGPSTVTVGIGPSADRLELFSEGSFNFDAGEVRTERYSFDLPPESGDWNTVAAYVGSNVSGAATSTINIRSPNFDQDVQVVETSWSPQVDSIPEGDEVSRLVTIENQGDVPYRVSITFTDSDGGNQIGAATISNLQPGDRKVVEQTVVAEPPEVTVCYSLSGQPIN